jgi:hypothetical protein
METTLPKFLIQQLNNLSDGHEIDMDLEALTTTTQWTKVTKAGYVRSTTTTAVKSAAPLSPWASPQVVDDTDDNSVYLPTSLINFQRDNSLQSELHRFRAGLNEKKEASDVKDCCFQTDVGHLSGHITRDASVYRTAYIRINGITPVMSLPDADMNMNATLTLIKSILRAIGRFTENAIDRFDYSDFSGLVLDEPFMIENYYTIWDSDHMAVTVKVRHVRWFGVNSYETVWNDYHVLPAAQRITKALEEQANGGQYYHVQALPEAYIERIIVNYTIYAVVRGVPSNAQSSPLMATCLLGVRDKVLEVLRKNLAPSGHSIKDDCIEVILSTIPHYFKRNNASQLYLTKQRVVPQLLRPLPTDGHQFDEPVIFVVWLGSGDTQSSETFAAARTLTAENYEFQIGGIPLELLSSVSKCREMPTYGDGLQTEAFFTRISNIRPGVTTREILLRVIRGELNRQHLTRLLRNLLGIYILPSIFRKIDGSLQHSPWILACVWARPDFQLPIGSILRSGALSDGNFVSLAYMKTTDIYGRGHVQMLHKAYLSLPRASVRQRDTHNQSTGRGGRGAAGGRDGGRHKVVTSGPSKVSPRPTTTPEIRTPGAKAQTVWTTGTTKPAPSMWETPSASVLAASNSRSHPYFAARPTTTASDSVSGSREVTMTTGSDELNDTAIRLTTVTSPADTFCETTRHSIGDDIAMLRGSDSTAGPMEITTSGINKRIRENTALGTARVEVSDNWEDDPQEEEEHIPVDQLRADNEKYAARFQKLLMDVTRYEAACSRLSQDLAKTPADTGLQDSLAGSQSMLQSTKIAMHKIYKSVEDNCDLLQENVTFYIPYDDDAWN